MKCPLDETTLVISERQGIEIDYCPQCRGVWLDRGELDKIIERAEVGPTPASRDTGHDRVGDTRNKNFNDSHKHQPKRKRRDSFLSDLFEFGD